MNGPPNGCADAFEQEKVGVPRPRASLPRSTLLPYERRLPRLVPIM